MPLDKNEEARLIEEVKQGQASSFEPLIETHQNQIYHLILSQLGNKDDALEVCQDVFLKAFHKIELFRGNSRFSTWVYRIAINECRSRYRSKKNKPKSTSLEFVADEGPDQTALSLEQKETKQQVRAAIQELNEDYSMPLILFHLQGKAHKEISEILGVPIGTVKTRIHRGHKQLADKLRGRFGPETSNKEEKAAKSGDSTFSQKNGNLSAGSDV
jgi:RNA polymerase sigma-70 factor (ECF subfamily)